MALSSLFNHIPLITSATHGTPDYAVNKWLLVRRGVIMIAIEAIATYAASRHKPLDIKFFAKYGIPLTALTFIIDCISSKIASNRLQKACSNARPEDETPSNNNVIEGQTLTNTSPGGEDTTSTASSSSSSSTGSETLPMDPLAKFLSDIPSKTKRREAQMRAFSHEEIQAYVESSPDNWSQIPNETKGLLLYSTASGRLLTAFQNQFLNDPDKTLNFYFDLFKFGGHELYELITILENANPLSEDQVKALYARILTSQSEQAFHSLIYLGVSGKKNPFKNYPSGVELKNLIQAALPFTNEALVQNMFRIQFEILNSTPDTPVTPILSKNNTKPSKLAQNLFPNTPTNSSTTVSSSQD